MESVRRAFALETWRLEGKIEGGCLEYPKQCQLVAVS